MAIELDTWHNCYDDSWDGFIVPDAFAHPAKYARGLITRIFQYMLAENMLAKGDVVVDPFGGIGTGGIIAAGMGLQWIGCELEEKFAKLGRENFRLHLRTWGEFNDPIPILVNGDSRKLRENIYAQAKRHQSDDQRLGACDAAAGSGIGSSVAGVVASPPYAGNEKSDYRVRDENGLDRDERRGYRQGQGCFRGSETYGQTPGNLGSMDHGSVEAVVSSPPYAESAVAKNSTGIDRRKQWETYRASGGGMGYEAFSAQQDRHSGDYGSSDGQLGAMPAGDVSAVVGSPPFSGSDQPCASQSRAIKSGGYDAIKAPTKRDADHTEGTPGQLSAMETGSVNAVVSSPPFLDARSYTTPSMKGASIKDITKHDPEAWGGADAVISSPPYAESLKGDNSERETAKETRDKRMTEGGSLGQSCRHSGYGGPGNLGNLPSGEVDAIATSPPYESQEVCGTRRELEKYDAGESRDRSYGDMGTGETFWLAARDIVRECHAILKHGGWSAWVVKDFIRNKQRVPFCDDWCKLLTACGFVVERRVRAMLVKEDRHPGLFGDEDVVKTTERKSFFRRLYEKKYPENSINWEEVIFARKP